MRKQIPKVANLVQNLNRPIQKGVPTWHDKSVEQLEAENYELRRRVAALALEIEVFREG